MDTKMHCRYPNGTRLKKAPKQQNIEKTPKLQKEDHQIRPESENPTNKRAINKKEIVESAPTARSQRIKQL